MANLLDLRRRIKSVKNTQQITKAMKMLSAVNLRRAQERVTNARPFAGKMTEVLTELAGYTDEIKEELVSAVNDFKASWQERAFNPQPDPPVDPAKAATTAAAGA